MTASSRTTARDAVVALLPPLPRRWQLVTDEAPAEGDRVRVRVAVREIAHSDTGAAAAHRITIHMTVTVPTDDGLAAAEADLDAAMDEWLFLLDDTDLAWERATKGRFADEGGRLGFELDITDIRTTPTEET